MFKTMIAGLTALSLSFTPAPAAALTDEEIGQLLLGLLAVGVVGKIIQDNNDRRASPTRQTPRAEQHQPRNLRHEQSRSQRHETNALPRDCLQIVDTQRGPQRIFGARCLNRNYRNAQSLPQQCAVRLRGYDGPRRGFDPSCLRDRGYSIRRY